MLRTAQRQDHRRSQGRNEQPNVRLILPEGAAKGEVFWLRKTPSAAASQTGYAQTQTYTYPDVTAITHTMLKEAIANLEAK